MHSQHWHAACIQMLCVHVFLSRDIMPIAVSLFPHRQGSLWIWGLSRGVHKTLLLLLLQTCFIYGRNYSSARIWDYLCSIVTSINGPLHWATSVIWAGQNKLKYSLFLSIPSSIKANGHSYSSGHWVIDYSLQRLHLSFTRQMSILEKDKPVHLGIFYKWPYQTVLVP